MDNRLEKVEAERDALLERKERLDERVEYLSDDRGVEAEIRRHFDVAKEGEQVVIILDDDEVTEPEVFATSTGDTSSPWYLFWR